MDDSASADDARGEILRRIATFDGPTSELRARLQTMGWDWNGPPLLVLTRVTVLAALGRYLDGRISPSQLEDWADALEVRDDVAYTEESLARIVSEIANPIINGSISAESARGWADRVRAAGPALSQISGIVRPGQRKAGPDLIAPHQERWERALGSPIYPASLNVYVPGDFGEWPWLLGNFGRDTRSVECLVEGIHSFVIWLRCPGPSWNEGHNEETYYPDDTMLEIICSERIAGVAPYSVVNVEIDLSALT